MAVKLSVFSNSLHHFGMLSLKSISDSTRLQFVRCQSIMAKKLVYSEYGDAMKVVRQEKETLTAPKDNEILVQMLAAPINPADINTIQGVYPVKPQLPSIPGNEGVGEVVAVGCGVSNLKTGDKVMPRGIAWGTWRTHGICEAKEMVKVPDNIGIVEAATVTVNPCTAYRMLRDFVSLKSGDTVLQNGANSAAGQNVIQMCRAWGLTSVNVVRNRENLDELKKYLTSLGASHILTEEELRTTDIFKKSVVPKPKLLLNCVGGKNALECLRHLDKGGIMVTYGGMSREPVTVPTSALIFKDVVVRGFWMTQWSKDHMGSAEQSQMFSDIWDMYKEGQLKPPAHKLIPFSQYKEALQNTMNPKGFTGLKYVFDFQS
ncbi:enoyl-[acyl-carrier-protein] reductase, mitochondrial [Periplaneta americana]|uniref:enoyl-[acyl-carrier-protein] reductase, mitochondrial n=1 Tax=Periplaneta americana TaxID=6978 RepID=UPI0037E89109